MPCEGEPIPLGEVSAVSPRKARLNTSPFELWFALAAVLIGILNLAVPDVINKSNLNVITPLWLTYVLNVGNVLAGATIMFGLWRGWRALESAGLWLFASQMLVGAMVVASLRGIAALTSIVFYLCMAGAATQRAVVVRRYRHITIALAEGTT